MKRWLAILAVLVVGGVLGAGAIVASTFVNSYTSAEAFCTSCHSMAPIGSDPHYLQSAHHASAAGVRANCADCHVPAGNWFVETYAHASGGLRDGIAELRGAARDPAAWTARLAALADEVRQEMRRDDSATCRKCHDADAIHPASEAGRAAHAMLTQRQVTCIDCHFNIVHAPIPPSASFLHGSGLGRARP
jgi:cytochrome c-type protein NapC